MPAWTVWGRSFDKRSGEPARSLSRVVPCQARARAVAAGATGTGSPPFHFYDNRQKYLAFVNTCNEKSGGGRGARRTS